MNGTGLNLRPIIFFCHLGNNVYLCTRIHRMLNHKRKEALAFKLSLMRSKRMLYAPNNSIKGEKSVVGCFEILNSFP